jgi:hypothetical protein
MVLCGSAWACVPCRRSHMCIASQVRAIRPQVPRVDAVIHLAGNGLSRAYKLAEVP